MKGAALCVLVFGSMKLVTSFRSLRTVVDGRGIGCRLRISQFSVSLCSASAQTGGEGGLVSTAQARRTRLTTTGGLKGLPVVTPAAELLAHAIRKSKKISQDMEIKNARNRARKWAAQRMDALSQEISRPLRDVLRMYKHQIPILHPFEATVADLTVQAMENRGERTLSAVLHDVNELRKAAMVIGKAAAAKAKSMEKKQDILEVMDNGYAAIEELFQQVGAQAGEWTPLYSPECTRD
jgi:LmbE family N-acetylglucosaminyl deacetylase